MLRSLTRGMDRELSWSLGDTWFGPSAGLGTLVPGLLQHRCGQGERGLGIFRLICVQPRDCILELGNDRGLGLPGASRFLRTSRPSRMSFVNGRFRSTRRSELLRS